MRKAQKKQAEGFVELLGQVHDEIKKAIEKKNIPAALSLLADCQDGAISLGELIEKTEGEDAPTISVLEEYCEKVYQIYGELSQEQAIAGKVHKTLRQSLTGIKNSIKNDIKIRQEVVFLPYKASMWDSLESVWKAAEEDPDCDAYVIPIPYYDKNPDGSFREKHYEGDQYPYYVPVVRYEDYDFEKRMPDKIYIHNPYDEYNYVTSVEPFFYSSNLKKFTEQLVYIPYFILEEIDPEDQAAVDGMKHFCTQPGVINADRVIVQSEAMRQIYVNVLTAHMAGAGYKRKYWEDRILGLGSPKVDKVLNTRKEDLAIPKEWLKVIQKPDGSFKKIVFYNTSVSALLHHNEKMLVKMQDVFSVFKENRDEVALLWRPHPLIKATISSMRPQLWAEYEEVVKEYKEEGWGIYDDTADVDRAVCLSDAYYGDVSSIVSLCKKKGMHVMMQNANVIEINNKNFLCDEHQSDHGKIPFAVSRGVLLENVFWCISHFFDGIWKYDLLLKELSYVTSLPESNDVNKDAYSEMLVYKGQLILIPAFSEYLVIYNTRTKNTKKIKLETMILNKNLWRWAGGFIYNNYLIVYPAASNLIYKIDLESHDIISLNVASYLLDWNYSNMVFHLDSGCESKGKIYLPLARQNRVLVLCIDDMKISCLEVDSKGSYFCCATIMQNSLFLAPEQNGAFIEYNLKTNSVNYIEKYPATYIREEYRSVLAMVPCENSVEIVPNYGNMFLKICDGQLQENEIWREWIQNKNERSKWASNDLIFEKVVSLENKILLISGRFNTVVEWDQTANKIIEYDINIDEVYKLEKYRSWENTWEREKYVFSLEDILQCSYDCKIDAVDTKKEIGDAIYQSSHFEL